MKKIITTLVFAVLVTALYSQDNYVIKKRLAENNGHSVTLIEKVNGQISKNIKEITEYTQRQKTNLDTVYNAQQIQAYVNALTKLQQGFTNLFMIADTIPVIKKGDKFYLPGDTINSITDRKHILSNDWQILNDFEQQLNTK